MGSTRIASRRYYILTTTYMNYVIFLPILYRLRTVNSHLLRLVFGKLKIMVFVVVMQLKVQIITRVPKFFRQPLGDDRKLDQSRT